MTALRQGLATYKIVGNNDEQAKGFLCLLHTLSEASLREVSPRSGNTRYFSPRRNPLFGPVEIGGQTCV